MQYSQCRNRRLRWKYVSASSTKGSFQAAVTGQDMLRLWCRSSNQHFTSILGINEFKLKALKRKRQNKTALAFYSISLGHTQIHSLSQMSAWLHVTKSVTIFVINQSVETKNLTCKDKYINKIVFAMPITNSELNKTRLNGICCYLTKLQAHQ